MCYLKHDEIPPSSQRSHTLPSKETLWRFKKNALYRTIFIGWKNSSIRMRYFAQFFFIKRNPLERKQKCVISHNFSMVKRNPLEVLKKCVIPHNFYRLEEFLYMNALYRTIFIGWKNSSRELIKMRYFT